MKNQEMVTAYELYMGEWYEVVTVQMSAGTRMMMEIEQNQVYPTVKIT